jgi:hypothetical protein
MFCRKPASGATLRSSLEGCRLPNRAVHKLPHEQVLYLWSIYIGRLRVRCFIRADWAWPSLARPEGAAAHSLAVSKCAIPLANKSGLDHRAVTFPIPPGYCYYSTTKALYNPGMLRDGVRRLVRRSLGRRSGSVQSEESATHFPLQYCRNRSS